MEERMGLYGDLGGRRGRVSPVFYVFVQMVHISSRLSFGSVCRDLVFTVTARKSFVFSNNSQSDLSLSLYIHFASRY